MITNANSQAFARTILISGGLTIGGTQTHVTVLCRVLLEAGAEVTVVATATNWPPEAVRNLKRMGVHVVVSPFGFGSLKVLSKATALLWPLRLLRNYDVLYCIGEGRMHLWASHFVKKGGWKIYHEIVGCPSPNSTAAQVAVTMDAIVANSALVREQLVQLFPEMITRVIPFFTADGPTPFSPRLPFAKEQLLRIVYLGRLVSHKRPDHLIEAWPGWNSQGPIGPSRLDLYGGDVSDSFQKQLQLRLETLGMENNVCLHGNYSHSDLPAILDSADLVVLPSLHEGLPLVLVEAMQRGIPVVATSAGGTSELGGANPDVIITAGTGWPEFEEGVKLMAQRLRSGEIDNTRLHDWTESRYGFESVSAAWRKALLETATYFK